MCVHFGGQGGEVTRTTVHMWKFGSFALCRPVRLLGVQKLVDWGSCALRAGASAYFGLISKTQGPHNAAGLLIRGHSGRCQLWIVIFDEKDLRRRTCPPALKCYRTPHLVPQNCCSERHSNFELLLQCKYGHLNSGKSNFCPSPYLCLRVPRSPTGEKNPLGFCSSVFLWDPLLTNQWYTHNCGKCGVVSRQLPEATGGRTKAKTS